LVDPFHHGDGEHKARHDTCKEPSNQLHTA
jgi:hypothetical protein